MSALFFIILGIYFVTMVYHAISTGELKARGWGFSTRIYRRDDEPVMFWVNFIVYLIVAAGAIVVGILVACKAWF